MMRLLVTSINKFLIFFRSLTFELIRLFLTILFCFIGNLTFFMKLEYRYKLITLWSKLNIYCVKYICGVNYKVSGLENVSSNAVIVTSNHQSAWETLFFQILFSKQTWILKNDLLKIPFFGWGLRLLDPIAINRKNKLRSLKFIIQKGRKKLANGWNIIYFPQGTRVEPNIKIKLSSGVFMLAKNSNFPILPVVHNAGVFWPKNSFLKYPGTIYIKIGKPIFDTTNVINSKKNLEDWMNENYSFFNNS